MLIKLENINYKYDSTSDKYALKNISLSIEQGELIGIVGATGSGKSTLAQHICGLIKPTSGSIYYKGQNIYNLAKFQKEVGIVFQFPEQQLFATSVISDVSFGPLNLGLSKKVALLYSQEALELVGIPERLYSHSPFNLSSGEQRRVAIACMLAMKPKVLILDEPTIGLDQKARKDLLTQISKLHKSGTTIIFISHNIDDIFEYTKRVLVINNGEIIHDTTPKKLFTKEKQLENLGLAIPQVSYIKKLLDKRGMKLKKNITTIDEAVAAIDKMLREKKL